MKYLVYTILIVIGIILFVCEVVKEISLIFKRAGKLPYTYHR